MILAAVGDTPYRIVLILHILSFMVAFAPAFVHPLVGRQSRSIDDPNFRKIVGMLAANGRKIYAPALIVTGLLGFALQGMSSGTWKFDQGWMIGALVVWIAMNGVLHGLLLPNERKLADGDDDAENIINIGGAIVTVLLLVMLCLMVFKPGL